MNTQWLRRAATFTLTAVLLLAQVSCATGARTGLSTEPSTKPPASTPTQGGNFATRTARVPNTPPVAPTMTQPAPDAPPGQTVSSSTISTATIEGIATASNVFGFNLLHELERSAPGSNLFFSPLSLSLLLQMAYNGAEGETAQEIAQVLQVAEIVGGEIVGGGTDVATMNAQSKVLQDTLQGNLTGTPAVELLIGNSIWVQQGFQLLDAFVTTIATFFGAQATTLDFASAAATNRVNAWVADATRGKIDTLFDALDPNVLAYLINTVYFKGAWSQPFDATRTATQPFRLADGSGISVPMMTQEGDFALSMAENYAALALPYGDGRVRMIVVLPDEGVELDSVVAQMTPAAWQTLLGELDDTRRVIVSLPRFTMQYDETLNDALMALGMHRAFSVPGFANMVEGGGLSISAIRHKAVVEVNEQGTEAAAVSVGTMTLSMPPAFNVNRPFFFAIHDATTNTILFMGVLYAPAQL